MFFVLFCFFCFSLQSFFSFPSPLCSEFFFLQTPDQQGIGKDGNNGLNDEEIEERARNSDWLEGEKNSIRVRASPPHFPPPSPFSSPLFSIRSPFAHLHLTSSSPLPSSLLRFFASSLLRFFASSLLRSSLFSLTSPIFAHPIHLCFFANLRSPSSYHSSTLLFFARLRSLLLSLPSSRPKCCRLRLAIIQPAANG